MKKIDWYEVWNKFGDWHFKLYMFRSDLVRSTEEIKMIAKLVEAQLKKKTKKRRKVK